MSTRASIAVPTRVRRLFLSSHLAFVGLSAVLLATLVSRHYYSQYMYM